MKGAAILDLVTDVSKVTKDFNVYSKDNLLIFDINAKGKTPADFSDIIEKFKVYIVDVKFEKKRLPYTFQTRKVTLIMK